MVVPDPNIYYHKLEYGLDDGKPWCLIVFQSLTEGTVNKFNDKECSYCSAPVLSYKFERVMDFSLGNENTPMNGEIKMSCWCAMWLYKAQQKRLEWNEIEPVFDEWIEEQEVPWVTSTI